MHKSLYGFDGPLAAPVHSPARHLAARVLRTSSRWLARLARQIALRQVHHAGWIAAAGGLAARNAGDPPHVILFPEIAFDEAAFLARVKATVDKVGYCTVVASEGLKNAAGEFLAEAGTRDAFGHAQLGGVAPVLANLVKQKLGYKYHWALPDYLQRSARHIASKTDADQAWAVGKAAVEYALAGKNAVMPVIVRTSDSPYRWKIEPAPLDKVANHEK